jgi:hypothetical protein
MVFSRQPSNEESDMPARKTPTRKVGQARAAAKTSSTRGALPPYGVPIREALARGDAAEMKKVSASAHKYLKEVQTAVASLDRALGKRKS